MPLRIPVTEAQTDKVVAEFYTRVRAHPALGPVFPAHVPDWPKHEEKIWRLWRNVLLFQRSYGGNPMRVPAAAGNVRSQHSWVWLLLLDTVLEQELPHQLARAWSALCHRIGRGLSYGLASESAKVGVPDLMV